MTWPKQQGIEALLNAKLPRLRDLAIVWVELRAANVKELVRWPVLRQLTALNLGHNPLGPDSVALLFAAGRMASMERLVLRATGLHARVEGSQVVHVLDGFEAIARTNG